MSKILLSNNENLIALVFKSVHHIAKTDMVLISSLLPNPLYPLLHVPIQESDSLETKSYYQLMFWLHFSTEVMTLFPSYPGYYYHGNSDIDTHYGLYTLKHLSFDVIYSN